MDPTYGKKLPYIGIILYQKFKMHQERLMFAYVVNLNRWCHLLLK